MSSDPNPIASSDLLAILDDPDPSARQRIREVVAPESVWMDFLDSQPEWRRAVASNRHLPRAVLDRLAADEDAIVRCDVAMKRALPAELFHQLAGDADETVRQRIAYNAKAPREVLEKLAGDVSPLIADAARERLMR